VPPSVVQDVPAEIGTVTNLILEVESLTRRIQTLETQLASISAKCILGVQGVQGAQGAQGAQGEKGEKGDPGDDGLDGKDAALPRIPRPSLGDLRDVDLSGLGDGSVLVWAADKRKWILGDFAN